MGPTLGSSGPRINFSMSMTGRRAKFGICTMTNGVSVLGGQTGRRAERSLQYERYINGDKSCSIFPERTLLFAFIPRTLRDMLKTLKSSQQHQQQHVLHHKY